MAVLLALFSAATYGIGDFCGGMATRRASPGAVLLWSHLLGLLSLGLAVALGAGTYSSQDLALGALGGTAGAVGIGLLYRGLAIGPMSVVAPITALLAAAVPVVVGYAQGERPGPSALVGMVAALAAIVLVSAEGSGTLRPSDPRGVSLAMGAGLCFGLFFVALSLTDEASGLWPLVGARLTSVVGVGGLALLKVLDVRMPRGGAGWFTVAAGVLDVVANACYLLAVREGLLSVVTVLTALYPVGTVVLARVVLNERFASLQRIGLAVAIPAAVLIAV
ncbi:MAG: DMT family transporter [Acidimicrobiales bacterium]